jgi:hypothetical protein
MFQGYDSIDSADSCVEAARAKEMFRAFFGSCFVEYEVLLGWLDEQ